MRLIISGRGLLFLAAVFFGFYYVRRIRRAFTRG
jgi:hypothetical protein